MYLPIVRRCIVGPNHQPILAACQIKRLLEQALLPALNPRWQQTAREAMRSAPLVSLDYRLIDLGHHLDLNAASHWQLRDTERRARVLARIAEYLAKEFRAAVRHQVVLGEFGR